MKSPSNDDNEDKITALHNESIKLVNSALNHSVSNLPENTLSDIAQARTIALNKNRTKAKPKISVVDTCITWLYNPMIKIGIPLAVAVVIAVSVKYVSVETIPELPLAIMATEIPNEDFAMLEDLEFVAWLAENEQSALL